MSNDHGEIPNIVNSTSLNNDEEDKGNKKSLGVRHKTMGIGYWNTYTRTSAYLNKTSGERKITSAELVLHNKPDDMWMALNHQNRLCVFDVTEFAKYHPGGFEILLNHAGTDASEAFRMAHSYVSTNMISKLQKGYLIRNAPGRNHMPNTLSPFLIPSKFSLTLGNTKKPIWDWEESNGKIELVIKFTKFDTILTSHPILDNLRTIILLKKSPDNEDHVIFIRTFLDDVYHCFELRLISNIYPDLTSIRLNLLENIENSHLQPFSLRLNLIRQISRSVNLNTPDLSELNIVNTATKPLSTIGTVLEDVLVPLNEEHQSKIDYFIENCQILQSYRVDNSAYRFIKVSYPSNCVHINVPIGHHVNIRLKHKDQYIIRPYTPVCDNLSLMINQSDVNKSNHNYVCFLIKIYTDGQLTQLIDQLKEGDLIDLSLPMGYLSGYIIYKWINSNKFSNYSLCNHYHIIMLAGGSGITPMLRIIDFILNGEKLEVDKKIFQLIKINLILFNRNQNEQILVSQLENLQSHFVNQFKVTHVLSEPLSSEIAQNDWIPGLISEQICCQALQINNSTDLDMGAAWLICGPVGFNNAAINLTKKWKIAPQNVFVFKS